MRLCRAQTTTLRAFTLVEVLITSATLVIIVASVIACNLFGLSMAERQQIWLGASSDAAQVVSTLEGDVRSVGNLGLQVGTFANNTFTQASNNTAQSGNALKIYTNTTSLPWTMYYYDMNTSNLIRSNYYGPGVAGDFSFVSANQITNDLTHPIFTQVDYTGATISNNNVPLSAVTVYLSFIKLQDPQIVIESGSVVDLYQIITTVSPRLRL